MTKTKILCGNSVDYNTMNGGLKSAAEKCGISFEIYEPSLVPAFDIFAQHKPDVFIGSYKDHTRALRKCLEQNKTKFYANEAIAWAYDSVTYKTGKKVPHLECDLSRVGIPVKGLFDYIPGDVRCRFYGDISYGCCDYMGKVEPSEYPDIYASSKMSVAVTMEEFFRVAGCGGTALYIGNMGNFNYFLNAKGMNKQVSDMIGWVMEDLVNVNQLREVMTPYIMENHTYFIRLAEILRVCGFYGLSTEVFHANKGL